MRVNVYAEEMTDRIEIISKGEFTGLRFYLELPVTTPQGEQIAGPFMHHPDDDDSAAVTFWGKRDLRHMLAVAESALDAHYGPWNVPEVPVPVDVIVGLGEWLSAALDDPEVCDAMKADIHRWFAATHLYATVQAAVLEVPGYESVVTDDMVAVFIQAFHGSVERGAQMDYREAVQRGLEAVRS